MGHWSELPEDLLDKVGKHLTYVDFIRLFAVCVHWKLVSPKMPKLRSSQIPWLLLPSDDGSNEHCNMYSLFDEKIFRLKLPEAKGRSLPGSSHGWLVTIEDALTLKLLNPLTRVEIDLPPISTFPCVKEYRAEKDGEEYTIERLGRYGGIDSYEKSYIHYYFIKKVVLSSNPTSSIHQDHIAMAIHGEFRTLAFCRYDDQKWKNVPTSCCCFEDIVFHEGKFYALTNHAKLVCVFFPSLEVIDIPVNEPERIDASKLYLVGIPDGLMMIERYYWAKGMYLPALEREVCGYGTTQFRIYKMNLCEQENKWSEVSGLGNNILFLGYNSSLFVSSQSFSDLKDNCIYFTDDWMDFHTAADNYGGFDIGVYDMGDGSIQRLPGYREDKYMVWPPPVWVMPSAR